MPVCAAEYVMVSDSDEFSDGAIDNGDDLDTECPPTAKRARVADATSVASPSPASTASLPSGNGSGQGAGAGGGASAGADGVHTGSGSGSGNGSGNGSPPLPWHAGRTAELFPKEPDQEPAAGAGVTRIQFRFPTRRVVRRVKKDAHVRDLFRFAATVLARPHTAVSSHAKAWDAFELATPHPAKSLLPDALSLATVEAAGLLNSVIIVRELEQ